jgi:hypothetical protein
MTKPMKKRPTDPRQSLALWRRLQAVEGRSAAIAIGEPTLRVG